MKKLLAVLALTVVAAPGFAQDSEWVSLWDGKTFKGWQKSGENPDSFCIEDGAIISNGPRCHLFYVGDVHGTKFKNFELEVDVMTQPSSNGGIYLVQDVEEVPAQDGEWFTEKIVVTGNRIRTYVNGKELTDWEQPAGWEAPGGMTGRFIQAEGGTIGFQSHDPNSKVAYKNIRIKVLD